MMWWGVVVKTVLLSASLWWLNLNHAHATAHNITCVLVFGDSSVDSGNNNRLASTVKANFRPYGIDFFNAHPSGRFSNGRLATDFLVEALGHMDTIRAFLDPAIAKKDLLHGVNFASAGSGYDDLTAKFTNVLAISKQVEYFRHYKIHLQNLVGREAAEDIIKDNALVVVSSGTNDFLANYYTSPTRSKQYSIEQYMSYLISRMRATIKDIRRLGARKVVVVGVPPMGCMPVLRSMRNITKCDVGLNKITFSFNSKIERELNRLGNWTLFVDVNRVILDAIHNPKRYGFVETLKGCCGTGTSEYGNTCRGKRTCSDRTRYVFWDAFHLTQKMHNIIADYALEQLLRYPF